MVALPSAARFAFVKRSIAAYMDQTYDRRELLIVLDQGPKEAKAAICDHVATLRRDDIRIIETAGVPTLGALRNFSRAHAQGELHCQWDDDDLHHPERVERQLEELTRTGAQAVCLQEVMQFFTTTGELYWTNWRATEATVMPATLLCQATVAARYPETGPTSRLGEDTEICTELLRQGQLHAMPDAPHLFVYVNHGANTWGDDFHRMLDQFAEQSATGPSQLDQLLRGR